MVSAAPTFSEVSAALAERLNGALLVAHNLPFDSRMLVNEYQRIGGQLDPGKGVCTLQLTRQKLVDAAKDQAIPFSHPHRALGDARTTARLLRPALERLDGRYLTPAEVDCPAHGFLPRTLRRDMSLEVEDEMPYLARLADRTHHYGEHGAVLVYMDLLDWAISDLVLTRTERAQLEELAIDLNLSSANVADVHRRYLDELVSASLRDGVVDSHEASILGRAAEELGVDPQYVVDRARNLLALDSSAVVSPGIRVCFTGSAIYADGTELHRSVLERHATDLGLRVVASVSRTGCDLLIAADPSSQSGKARNARQYGLPVASVHDFLLAQAGGPIATGA
jgi:DNA polymerase-3 subunit epsilon